MCLLTLDYYSGNIYNIQMSNTSIILLIQQIFKRIQKYDKFIRRP